MARLLYQVADFLSSPIKTHKKGGKMILAGKIIMLVSIVGFLVFLLLGTLPRTEHWVNRLLGDKEEK